MDEALHNEVEIMQIKIEPIKTKIKEQSICGVRPPSSSNITSWFSVAFLAKKSHS